MHTVLISHDGLGSRPCTGYLDTMLGSQIDAGPAVTALGLAGDVPCVHL
jgi:hypothetical protein